MKELLQQTTAYKLLSHERDQAQLSHTYLLIYNDETNLRNALKEFAKLFFDGSAHTNDRIDGEKFIDCMILPEEGKALDKDGTAKIIEESLLSPVEGKRKLFVLDNMHKASVVVQNKLLKVLEEPPEGVHFLLGATSEFPLLTTVKSRAKKLEIPPFSEQSIGACLSRMYPDKPKDELYEYALASDGSLGRAQNLMNGGRYAVLTQRAYDCVAASAHGGGEIVKATRALSDVTEKTELLALMERMYRDMLMMKAVSGNYILLKNIQDKLRALSEKFTAGELVFALDMLSGAAKELTFNANLSQCMEVALLKIDKNKEKKNRC